MCSVRYAWLAMIGALLAGCAAPYERFVADTHARYEDSLAKTIILGPPYSRRASAAPAPRNRSLGSRTPASPPRATAVQQAFRLEGKTPKRGTPEWEREQAYFEQREQQIRQRIQGICANC